MTQTLGDEPINLPQHRQVDVESCGKLPGKILVVQDLKKKLSSLYIIQDL